MSTALADHLRGLADAIDSFPGTTDELRAIQAAENVLAARKALVVQDMTERADYEAEGYSTAKAWMRHQLRMDASAVNTLFSAGKVLRELPGARDAARAGEISLEHYKPLAYALRHIEPAVVARNAAAMLEIARLGEPKLLKQTIRKLRADLYPDELDEAWIRGMDREDITISEVPDGWHLHGFLNTQTGAKLATILQSLSEPTEAGDTRTNAQRRVDGLDQLLTGILENGLPSDNGIRPHLTLTVDLADLVEDPDKVNADLAGFGTIGPRQLQQLICDADLTPILTAGKHTVLDVGRTQRLATAGQRKAILARQHRRCAGPGCRHPIAHFHHLTPWSRGGPTDLTNLTGLCARCHTAVHRGTITLTPAQPTLVA